MSQEKVERLYRAYDAFNRRDLDAYLALSRRCRGSQSVLGEFHKSDPV
jgi:hypothetical protein